MHMRDPILYRIKHEHHHRTGDAWCIYTMYDFAHGQSDSLEGITHSLCSLEFRHHRPLYEWFIEQLGIFPSRQIEFARMNVSYMITSKRRLLRLVNEQLVTGWDDPRMPTLAGMRRRGYPPAALRDFCMRTGVAKRDNTIEIELLEYFVREELNKEATRAMAVLDPLRVVITNYPEGQIEELSLENNPENAEAGIHSVPFGREIYIEREDFMVDPPKKYFRMAPGADVRLKSAYILHCEGYEADPSTGEVQVVYCSYYPNSRSGEDTSGIKAKGTLHWVSVAASKEVEVRMYDRLFTQPDPTADEEADFLSLVNPASLMVVSARAEPFLLEAQAGQSFQFLRKGYFTADKDSKPGAPVFNLTVDLKTSFKPS
jgi:glutaminyl-tRNA synthetase